MAVDNRKTYAILIIILALNILLTVQGIGWGLPDRWNVDQKVTEALKMAAEKTLVSPDFYHPPFYTYLLMLVLTPYILYLKLTHYPLDQVGVMAADSWVKVASAFPDFATNVFIMARLFSCFLGVLTVVFTFLIARRMYSTAVALIAAGILATTMGFAGANHLEISTPLIGLLGAIVVYFCVRAIDTRRLRDTLIASLCAGLAVATKLNGVFLLPLPFIAYILSRRKGVSLAGDIAMLSATCAAGFLIGWPTYFSVLPQAMVGYKCYANFLFLSPADVTVPANFINYLLQLVIIFGIPYSIFIVFGLATAARLFLGKDASNSKLVIPIFLIGSYIFMNGISAHHHHPYTKYIVFIAPQLAVIGGLGAYELFKRINITARFALAMVFFGYSIAYTVSGNAQFLNRDIRYKSTDWIERNIPKGATIEHVDQPDWLFSSRILKNYRIIYLGRDSRNYASKGFYKLNQTGDLKDVARIIEGYCRKINETAPSSEYFVIFLPEVSDLYLKTDPVTEYDKLIRNFIGGKFPYDLVVTFKASNWRNLSSVIRGLSYPHNLFWDPIPDNAYMPSIILVYKKKQAS